jgi:hypothetical protein
MKELAFRVKDKEGKIHEVGTLSFVSNAHAVVVTVLEDGCQRFEWPEECDLLMYSGYRDIAGQKVFEGDRIKGNFYDEEREAKIVFENGAFWIKGNDVIGNTEGFAFPLHLWYDKIEVVK